MEFFPCGHDPGCCAINSASSTRYHEYLPKRSSFVTGEVATGGGHQRSAELAALVVTTGHAQDLLNVDDAGGCHRRPCSGARI